MTPEYRIGTSGWTYQHWRGVFYPQRLPQRLWFDYYARQFSTVEVNATFYRSFADSTYRQWRERAPGNFRYVLKAPQRISHRKRLVDVAEDWRAFLDQASHLGDALGLILLQLPPHCPLDLELLESALLASGEPERVAVEFRHPDWLSSSTYELLARLGATFVCVDSPRQPLAATLTSDCGYIRLHGRRAWYRYDYTTDEINQIATVAEELTGGGARCVYVFFNNDIDGFAPANARALMARLACSAK